MAASASIAAQVAGLRRQFFDASSDEVLPPNPPAKIIETFEANTWFVAEFIPSATTASMDLVSAATVGMTSPDINKGGATAFGSAKYFLLTAQLKPGATGAILDNLIIATVNSVEIGRIYVSAEKQQGGIFQAVIPGDRDDSRMAFGGTNDLTFTLTSADPNLLIHVEAAGQD